MFVVRFIFLLNTRIMDKYLLHYTCFIYLSTFFYSCFFSSIQPLFFYTCFFSTYVLSIHLHFSTRVLSIYLSFLYTCFISSIQEKIFEKMNRKHSDFLISSRFIFSQDKNCVQFNNNLHMDTVLKYWILHKFTVFVSCL